MTTIYIVTSGTYSDYGIEAVFRSREDAETFVKAQDDQPDNWEDFRVETYDLVEELGQSRKVLTLRGWVYKDGSEEREQENVLFPGLSPLPNKCEVRQTVQMLRYGNPCIFIEALGTDFERVHKVFSEKKAQALAEFDILIEAERSKQGDRTLRVVGGDKDS